MQRISRKSLNTIETTEYEIINIEAPWSWRLIKQRSEDGTDGPSAMELEEELFDIHGILCRYDLPPIQIRDIFYLKKKAKFIQQVIRITRFDTPVFQATVSKINEVQELIKKSIILNTIMEWHPATYEGEHALDISTRYFTPRQNVPHERGQAFGIVVDPNGILADVRGQKLIHGNENEVEYLQEYRNQQGETKRKEIEPALFNVGNIIHATVAFIVFPTQNGNATMTIQLRALTQIEGAKSKTNEDHQITTSAIHKTNTIKRKSILDREREAREGLEQMKIDDNIERSKRIRA